MEQYRTQMKLVTALVLAFVVISSGQSLETYQPLETYLEKYIVRLPPAAFPEAFGQSAAGASTPTMNDPTRGFFACEYEEGK